MKIHSQLLIQEGSKVRNCKWERGSENILWEETPASCGIRIGHLWYSIVQNCSLDSTNVVREAACGRWLENWIELADLAEASGSCGVRTGHLVVQM